MKLRKILSLVLAAALLCSVCFIGGTVSAEATAVVKENGNYLLNGSFELVETREEGTLYSFKNYCINHGGTGTLVDYWKTFNWLNGNSAANPNIKITHTTDAHSGDYALYFDIPVSNTHYVYPSALAVDTLPAGNYRLSAWVKGTNSASTINVTDADGNVKSVNVAASDDWTEISIDGITSVGTTTVGSNEVIGITITPMMGDAASYFVIDDIRLEAVEASSPVIFSYSSLETADTVWNSAEGKSGMTGFTDFVPARGQYNKFVDGWRYQSWGDIGESRIWLDHTTDAHTGNYAVKAKVQSTDTAITIYPDNSSINTDAITEGYYTFSVWVKSNNNASGTKLEVKSTVPDSDTAATYSTAVTAGEEWHQINLYDVYLTDGAANVAAFGSYKHIKLLIAADTSVTDDTYVVFDDFALTKQNEFYNGGMEISGKGANVAINGQANPNTILQGYTAQDWTGKKTTYDIVSDAHSGNQALKITNGGSGTVYTRYDGSDIQPGTYKFSGWAKGNSSNAIFRAYQATTAEPTKELGGSVKKNFTLTDLSETEWKYYEFVFTIAEGYTIKRTAEQSGGCYFNALGFGINGGTAGEYAIFDDIAFEKIDDVNAVAASVVGIDSPAKGATKLELPSFGSHITVSIVASSDESLVALDGTIAPCLYRSFVDITLELTDGTTTVTLDPVGVVIPGTSQLEIDAVEYAIKMLPNDNASNPILPTHFDDFEAVRALFNTLSADEQALVSNAVVLGQRENTMDNYGASIGEASLTKDGQLRVKAAYPTKFVDGYTVKEYGMLFIPTALAANENITLETANVSASVMTFVPTEADTYFYSVLKDSALSGHADTEILMRSYVTYEYTENDATETVTVYSRFTVKRSVAALMAD